jgi:hypothetical protein
MIFARGPAPVPAPWHVLAGSDKDGMGAMGYLGYSNGTTRWRQVRRCRLLAIASSRLVSLHLHPSAVASRGRVSRVSAAQAATVRYRPSAAWCYMSAARESCCGVYSVPVVVLQGYSEYPLGGTGVLSRTSVMLWGVLGTKLDKLCPDLRAIGVATRVQSGLGVIGVATAARSSLKCHFTEFVLLTDYVVDDGLHFGDQRRNRVVSEVHLPFRTGSDVRR